MNKRSRRSVVYLILFAAEGVEMPTCYVIGMIFVAAQHSRVASVAQTKVHVRLALVFADQNSDYELPPFAFKLGKSPFPSWAKGPGLLSRPR